MRAALICSCFFLLASCGGETGPQNVGGPTAVSAPAERTNGKISGPAVYERYCIACHETGLLDAPVVGNAQEWAEVSKLWQAVVVEHAQEGYFDMPAKGGRPDLPDDVVQAAVEHMLTLTYPDLPADIR